MLDRLPQLPLFSPLLLLDPDGSSPSQGQAGAAASAQPQAQAQPIGQEAMAALGWLSHTSAAAAATSMGGGSCCPLPPVRIQLPPGMRVPAAGAAPTGAAAHQAAVSGIRQPAITPPAAALAAGPAQLFPQPADSQATMASAGAAAQGQRPLQSSPEVGQQPLLGLMADMSMPAPAAPAQQAASEAAADAAEEQQGGFAPDWLVQGIASVAERSQGSRDAVEGRQLLGRR